MSRNGTDPLARRLARYSEAVRLVDEGKARPQVVEVVQLLRQGVKPMDMPEMLGLARSTVYQRLNDPTDERNRARKEEHCGTCEECGGRTTYGSVQKCNRCARAQNLDRNERIIELWEQGVKAKAIGEELGMTHEAVTSWINNERQRGGMPIRLHRLRNREAWPTIERLWNAGAPAAEIAEAAGAASRESLHRMVKTMRDNGHELESRRNRRDDERRAELVRLWNEGLPQAEIAERLGITTGGTGNWVGQLRRKGYDLPYRRKAA